MLGRNWLIAAIAIVVLSKAAWSDDPPAATPTAQDLRSLVAQLDHDDYAQREEAAKKLTEAGPAAIAPLVEGIGSDQAEVAWRCGAALEQIGLEGDERTIDQIVKQLDAASAKTGRQGLKSLAADLHARQKQFRRERAINQIRRHGGQIAGSGIDGGMDPIGGGMAMPFIGPAIVFDAPVMEMEVAAAALPIPVPEPPELPRAEAFDLFAEIGRALGRAIAPAGARPPEAPPAEMKAAEAEEAAAEAKRAVEEAVKELEKAVEAATKEVEAAAEEKPAEEKPAEDKPPEEPPPAVEAAVVEADPLLVVPGIALADVGFVEMAVAGEAAGEGIGWAQMSLDQNWKGGDDGLAILTDLPELAQIDLRQTPLTDKALAHLAKLPNLRQLNVHKPGFSRDALLKFHRERPSVVIYARGEAMMGVNADFSTSPLMLSSIYGGSGAEEAGLQSGDVIHQIDGAKIRDFSDLTICVTAKQPGEKIEVEYERAGKKQTVQVMLKPRTIDQ